MINLRSGLRDTVARMSRENHVALMLSSGRDSITTGIACQEAGKTVHAYTYELDSYRSAEREKVVSIARHLGWKLSVVTVPTNNLSDDFKRLAIGLGCRKKVHFEVSHPLQYLIREIEEDEIWTGWNADDHYGNTREYVFHQARLKQDSASPSVRKADFDAYRSQTYAEFDKPDSNHTYWKAVTIANRLGKRILDAYADTRWRTFFEQFDHDQLSPQSKPILREAFADVFAGFPEKWVTKGERLQKGGRVDELFRTLLTNPDINRFERTYDAVSPLCLRWAAEVAANPSEYAEQLAGLPAQPRARVRVSGAEEYRPYVMADVMNASRAEKFTVVSTFAGGGGSSTGYRLAGGKVVLANEFVREAARTYRINFPDTTVDQRDIREISASIESVIKFLEIVGLKPGELDVLDGSPPCSEFSTAGRGIGDQDVLRPYSDVMQSNIASLPFDLVDLAIRAKPKIFICENVPAFASRGREVFDRVLRALRVADGRTYYANWQVLTASDFGVPQKRKRLFIIGVRKDVGDLIGIDSDKAVIDVFPTPTQVDVTIASAFMGLIQRRDDVWPWTRSAMAPSLAKLIRLLPKKPLKPTRLVHIFPDLKNNYTLTRCSWDRPAPTMVVTGQRPDSRTGCIHPEFDRKFTLPELRRLTGLPDDFVLSGTFGQASERICRMVPPLLTKAIAESVYAKVLLPYKEKTQ
jgi:DNA-cytosine methyltransferase